MAYAIMQRELVPPALEQLKRAFSIWPALTDLDAQTAAKDAYGILLRGLEVEQASALQDALLKEKIETAVVEESELPIIPPAKHAKQMEFFSSHLLLHDPLGRNFNVPWNEIMFIAAGNVRLQEIKRVKALHEEPQFHGSGISYDTV